VLEAISEVSTAFGGAGGASNVIEGFGETVGNVIEVFGTLAAGIASLVAQQEQGTDSGRNFGDVLTGYATWVGAAVPPLGALANAFSMVNDAGEVMQDSEAALKAQMDGLREAGGAGDAQMRRYALGIGAAAKEAYNADAAMEALKDAVKEFQDAISLSQSMDDFREDLRNIGADLKGAATTIFGPAGKDVRDKAREIFGQIPTIVQQMVDQGKIAQGDFQSTVDSMARQALTSFAKNKVKRQDLENWLGEQGIWSDPAKDRAKQVAIDAAAAAAKAGKDLGIALAQGIPVGLLSQTKAVQASAMRLIAQAEAAARAEADSHSPSRVWAKIGADLVDGLIVGLDSKKDKVKQHSEQLLSAMADTASGLVDKWDEKLEGLGDVLENAQTAVAEWASDMRENLLSGFDIGSAYDAALDKDGKLSASQWIAGVDAQIAEMEWFYNVLNAVRANGGPGGQALMDYLASKGATVGGAMGQAMIDEGLILTMSEKMAAVTTEADTMAQSMVPPYMTAGVAQAQAMYDGFKANFGEGGPARIAIENLMDRIAASLNRDVTVTIRTVYAAAGIDPPGRRDIDGKRANGGPVSSGGTYLVGERGPELFTPSTSGTIIPNGGSMRSGGGNTYAVSVYVAPGGDLAGAGRQMVEAIRAYERSSGKVYAAA